ncbi:hypothetical protein [Nonomuraea gerenzanensis]|uniref:Phage protein n=1 Tax=Nonomuraea gerenzanensis TaxID=93944 RepID=A0A1M4BL67_9ACTN|nr:hypothetical protein [Nonomuraea gerenzanensis]UBU10037.1 hypothetical protein LCN96_37550 [Nonomuraea gerenzanensis]SAP16254.1 hypothetical protein BN4615_P10917 [Nonomuraea gerenzanensis]
MPKINIAGESTEFDLDHMPLHEGIALQKATGWRMKELGEACATGDLVAVAALVWLGLRRMGKDVSFADITDGVHPIDISTITIDMEEEPPPPSNGEAKTSPANV